MQIPKEYIQPIYGLTLQIDLTRGQGSLTAEIRVPLDINRFLNGKDIIEALYLPPISLDLVEQTLPTIP
jgi:hypothetical protein